jgi:hypothetical protein
VPCKIFARISSRKPFANAVATISAATPIMIPSIAINAVTRARRRFDRERRYRSAKKSS